MDPTRDEPGRKPDEQEESVLVPEPIEPTEPAVPTPIDLGGAHPAQPSDASSAYDAVRMNDLDNLAGEPEAPFDGPGAPLDGPTAPPDEHAHFPHSVPFPDTARPSFLFFGVVTALSLFADISTKVWAEVILNERGFEPLKLVGDNLAITLAYNQGGAWGLLSTADPMLRKPFFLVVSAFAIFFIISLYSRLHPTQRALKWGLPLVLGGALGNLSDRITRSQVIDFIDYHADWVMSLNSFVHKYVSSWAVTDHWPTFNVADIAICIGVGLMGVDMFTHRPRQRALSSPPRAPSVPPGPGPGVSPEAQQIAP